VCVKGTTLHTYPGRPTREKKENSRSPHLGYTGIFTQRETGQRLVRKVKESPGKRGEECPISSSSGAKDRSFLKRH